MRDIIFQTGVVNDFAKFMETAAAGSLAGYACVDFPASSKSPAPNAD
jgi:hypothetical protein